MKLSLSLRGWTGLSFAELQESASEMRFQGVELYNIHKFDNFTGPEAPFNPYHIQSTLRSMKEKKLEIPCIDSSCELVPSEEDNIRMLIRASEDFRVPYTAVCCHEDDEETALSVLSRLIPFARDHHVCLLIKTSGIYADTARLRRVLDSFACDEVGALWDVHHPYRDFDELPGETVEHLVRPGHLLRPDRPEHVDPVVGGAGGQQFEYIPCLNENDAWIDALCRITRAHLGNWLELPEPDPQALERSRQRARELGAQR